MEASETPAESPEVQESPEEATEAHTEAVEGISAEETPLADQLDQEPIKAEDEHGSVTPKSAPAPEHLSGSPLDAATQQAINPDQPNPAQGEATPPA